MCARLPDAVAINQDTGRPAASMIAVPQQLSLSQDVGVAVCVISVAICSMVCSRVALTVTRHRNKT